MTTIITPPNTLVAQAQTHQQFGRFDQAFADFFHAGQLYFQQGQNDKAADCFRRLLRLETSDIELQLELVRSFLKLNLIEEASQAFCLCADHFDTLGILDTILSLANELLQTDPELDHVRDKLIEVLVRDTEIYLSYHLPEQARAGLKRALQYFPQCVRIHQEILNLARKTNDTHGQLTALLNLAKLTTDDHKTAVNYLSCALSIADDPDEIYAYGNAIGIVLRPPLSLTSSLGDEITETQSDINRSHLTAISTPQTPLPDNEVFVRSSQPTPIFTSSLADETTNTPEFFTHTPDQTDPTPPHPEPDISPKPEREPGLESDSETNDLSLRQRLARKLKANTITLKPTPNLPLLLAILRTVEQAHTPTKITIRTPETIAPTCAEIHAQNGQICTDLHLNNQPLADHNPQTTNLSNRYDNLAAQLLKIACTFDGQNFEIQQTPSHEALTTPQNLSLMKLLMTCIRHTFPSKPNNQLNTLTTDFFHTLSAPCVENAWLFHTNPLEPNLPLPTEYMSSGSAPSEFSIESIESLSQQLVYKITALQTYLPENERSQPLITNFIADDYALTYLHTPEHIVIIRTTLQNFGRLVTNTRQLIDNHTEQITQS